jgi:amino acid transporter
VENYHLRAGPLNVTTIHGGYQIVELRGIGSSLLFGFAAAMLGITGFETSANYVEEQAPGVFPKTLRNMWFLVAILNPVLSFLSLSVLPLSVVMGYPLDQDNNPNNANLLQQMASQKWMQRLVSVDAFLVLCGSVLTSYVGVGGLIHRMALDRVMPNFLLQENRFFHTRHFIIFGFFGVCTSLFYIVQRRVLILGSIYAIAFLCVMALFACGNLLLKFKRPKIRREFHAHVITVLCGLTAVLLGIYGNIVINLANMKYFALYLGLTFLGVFIMFQRVRLLKVKK